MNKTTKLLLSFGLAGALTLGMSSCVVTGELVNDTTSSPKTSATPETSKVKLSEAEQQQIISDTYSTVMLAALQASPETAKKLSEQIETIDENESDEAKTKKSLKYIKEALGDDIVSKINITPENEHVIVSTFGSGILMSEFLPDNIILNVPAEKITINGDTASFSNQDIEVIYDGESVPSDEAERPVNFIKIDGQWLLNFSDNS